MATLEVYRDKRGGWRWRLVVCNGRIVADGAEGYASRRNAQRAARRMLAQVRQAVELTVEGLKPGRWIL